MSSNLIYKKLKLCHSCLSTISSLIDSKSDLPMVTALTKEENNTQ